ncbi:hypothetical protein [Cyanobium sp. BA20m-p-22]|nr:hypothetical protein [Cyanobium sp. BA20m-p-22]
MIKRVLSDKLFYWLFQRRPELPALILEAQRGDYLASTPGRWW